MDRRLRPGTRCKASSRSGSPEATHARCCRAFPTSTSSTASVSTLLTAREPAGPARRHDHADERQLRRHRHRRLLAAGRQPEFRYGRGRAGPGPGVLDPVHRSTNKWVFNGIKVQSLFGTNNNKQALVTVTDQGAAFPTSDIILENMQISSADSTDGWTKAEWLARVRVVGISAKGTDHGANTTCVSVTNSHISKVIFGAEVMANNMLFSGNEIDHFGDDGIDYVASNILITKNYIHDNLDLGNGTHMDGMQGYPGGVQQHRYRQQPGHPTDGSEAAVPDLSARDRRLRWGLDEPDRDEQRGRDQLLLGHLLCERAWRQDHQQHGCRGRLDAHARELQAARGRRRQDPSRLAHPAT